MKFSNKKIVTLLLTMMLVASMVVGAAGCGNSGQAQNQQAQPQSLLQPGRRNQQPTQGQGFGPGRRMPGFGRNTGTRQ